MGFHAHPEGPHSDHSAHYGGQLGMAGDHHIEFLRRNGRIAVFPSDAERRPLDVAGVSVVSATGKQVARDWRRDRWEADDTIPGPEVTVRWWLDGEEVRSMDFVAPAALE